MSDEISLTKDFFEKKHIVLSNEWLESCINWYKQENEGIPYTITDMQIGVFEQWLLLDFREVNVPTIPPNIINAKKTILDKNICLQIMQIVDISKPKLWQLQKIRNSTNQNTEQDALTGKRVLQLTLTDGVQEILATEYKPVSCITLNLSAGIKVRLNAPITIRRGQVMLDNNSIKILGGEVEELLVANAAENVLAKLLNLPLNNTPTIVEETFENADMEIINQIKQTGNKVVANKIQSSITDFTKTNTKKIEDMFNKSIGDFSAEDELRINEEINLLLEAERFNVTGNHQATSTQKPKKTTPDIFDDDFDDQDFDQIDKIANSQIKSALNKKVIANNDFDSDEFDEMLAIERELSLDNKKPKQTKQIDEIKMPMKRKVMTIKDLLKIKENVTKGKFTIHARFRQVVKKLTIADNAFSMKVTLEDDEDQELLVAFHSDVIAHLLEYTVEEIMELKQQVLQNNDSTKSAIILSAINGVRDKLLLLDHNIEILIEGNNDPTVVKIINL